MNSFTDGFFSNSNTKSTSTRTKKKKKEYDVDNFTNSFFESYSGSDSAKTESSNDDFYNEYNAFIDELNGTRVDYYKTLQKNEEKRQREIDKKNIEQAEAYYKNNKEALKQKRTNDLIYNWNWQNAGGTSYDYGSTPIQNNKGYLKKTDSNGNVYWVDAKKDLLYDSNGNLINDDRLKDSDFINDLKYEYDENAKSNINTSALKRGDRAGVAPIDYSKYKFLIDNENNNIENNRKKWEQNYQNKNAFSTNNKWQFKTQDYNMVNNHKDEGWIIKDGNYYKPIENGKSTSSADFVGPMPKTNSQNLPTNIRVNNKTYELVTDEKPRSLIESSKFKNVYEEDFEKLNKAIENNDVTTANNALQEINKKYFGHQYEDGWWSALLNKNSDDWSFFQNKFQNNVEQLNVINDSIKNTKDADLLEELEKEKNRLELENTLIQYNRLYAYHSDMNLLDKMDSITKPVDEAWNKVNKLWSETFNELDDGYQFGDIFKTAKHTFNNIVQSVGTLGKQTNAGIQGIETLLVSDMDDSEFKDTWLPAIIDVGTYLIPYVGQARMIINYAEPGAVVVAGITREGSATIDSEDDEARVPTLTNVIGAATNIVANYASDKIFKSIRSKMSPETLKNIYSNQGRAIALSIFKEAGGEAFEEFIQTYAEYAQNLNGNIDSFSSFGDFLSEHFDEAFKSATIAAITAGGASTIASGIGAIRHTGTPETNADVVDNIRVNRSIKDDSNTTLFNVSNTKKFENLKPETLKHSQVDLQVDSDAAIEIATELENGNIITLLDTNAIKSKSKQNVDLNNVSDTTILSDSVINNNIKTVLVPSKEIETYIKNLRDDLTVYTIDPKSDTFMDDVKEYISETNKSNIVTKNAADFIPSNYTFTPDEMTQINKMVNESINKGNLLDNINNPNTYKLSPITVSDITDSDINTIMNTIRNKFLNEIDSNRISKETAKKEFKQLNNKLSEYAQKTKQTRTYIKDNKNSIITFVKRGSNIYEAVNTLPKNDANLETFANVKTNGNIINGNLNQKVKFSNKQMNAVNNLIDKLGLKGNYITADSTYKNVATLVKSNLEFSKEILQSLGADGLIEGKAKTRLYTAFDNLDNANPKGAIQNTNKLLESETFKSEIKTKTETTAPKQVTKKVEPSKIDIESEPIKVKDVAYDVNNTTEINNAEFEKLWNKAFKDIKISDKMTKVETDKLKTTVRKLFFDRYVHIRDIANDNGDYNVKEAIANLEAVASDAQNMIASAQTNSNGEIIGKSLKQIYSQLNGKKQKQLFEKYMMLELNIERENAGVDKIFENMSKAESRKLADGLLKKNPKFKEIANDLQRYNNNLLNALVDGGVINKELSNKLKNRYKFYMPIYSSELSTFADLNSDKYFKNMKVNDTIKDVTKSGKYIQTLEKSLENKTYNVLSAIAKNKLANEMALSNNYESDGKGEMIYYSDGKIMKMKTSNDIIADISNNSLSHIADQINQIPVLKQMIAASNLSYKFILDPIYQAKNVVIDFTDSQLIYSKDKKNFAKNYVRAAIAVANNSEVFNEFKEVGLAELGTGWKAPRVTYDKDGNISYNQNKFQRIFANLEAMPKLAEYLSLKDKYMKQNMKDYKDGKYTIVDNHLEFNKDEDYAIKQWSGSDSYIINQHYRDGTPIDERTQKIANGMDSVLNKIKSESGTFNRSIMLEGDKLQDFINRYKKGKIVTEDAFTSMSKDIIYAESFNIQMEIKSSNAKDTTKLMRADENEFMLKRGSQFKVDKVNIISPTSKRGQDFNKFNETIVKGHNGKPVYISRHTSKPDEIDYIKTYKQHNIDNYGWWYANSPTDDDYYNSNESNKFMNDLFDKSTVEMINDKKGVFATISEEYLTPPSQEEISSNGRYNYIEGYLTGKIFDISADEGYLPFDVSNKSEIDTREKFENLKQKRRDTVTQIYTNLKNKYDKNNKYSLDDFRKYIPLVDALKLDGYTGIVSDYNNGTKEIVIFDESKFMPLKEYNELSNKNTTVELKLTDVTKDLTTIYKNNISINDIQEQAKLRAKIEAQDVNLNFDSGGTLSKALSKSGFKFLNAGMLGFDKFMTHVGNNVKTPKGMGSLLFEFTSIGLATALANQLLNGDDEDYDKLPYYYKNNYYMIKVGDNNFFRIPKGRVQSLYNVLFEYSTGIRTEDSAQAYLESIKAAFDSAVLPPDFNTAAPYAAWQAIVSNEDAFGNEIYSEEYDSTGEKVQKGIYHLLSSYFGRYGRMVKDITDDDSTTDWFNELEYYKDTTKVDRHYSTALDLVTYYQNKDNVKTLDDRMMKKYIDTQNAALNSINSEINEGKRSGQTTKDLSMKYAARNDLIKSMTTNYKNFDISYEDNGTIRYYFDEHCFEYNPKTDKIIKKY